MVRRLVNNVRKQLPKGSIKLQSKKEKEKEDYPGNAGEIYEEKTGKNPQTKT